MDDPYEPPRSPVRIDVDARPGSDRLSPSACLAAVVIGGATTLAVFWVEAVLIALAAAGRWIPRPGRPIMTAIELVPIALGVLAGWTLLERARRRAEAGWRSARK